MIDPLPELSSDLDWMLQSGQANNAMLVEALSDEYFAPVYRLALAILNDPGAARLAVQETFVSALLNVYRYREKDGVQTWLFRIFFDCCRRISRRIRSSHEWGTASLPEAASFSRVSKPESVSDLVLWRTLDAFGEKTRDPVLLHYLLGWEIPEIARVLRVNENSVRSQLKLARREFLFELKAAPDQAGFSNVDLEAANFDQHLELSLQARWPAPNLSREELDREIEVVLSQAGVQGARRRSFTSLKEVLWTGVAIVLVVGLIWLVNNLLPEEPETQQGRGAAAVAQETGSRSVKTPAPTRRHWHATRQAILPPTETAEPTPTPGDVFYVVQAGDTLESIATRLGVPAEELSTFNRLASPDSIHPGMRLVVPSRLPTSSPITATPVTPVAQSEPLQTPSSSYEIYQFLRMRRNSGSTVWVDAQVIHYGPQGYVGPPIVTRNQLWLSDSQFLALHGPPDGEPQVVFLRNGGDLYLAKPGIDIPWFFPVRGEVPADSQATEDLNLLFNTMFSAFPRNGVGLHLNVVGSDEVAGRETWIVDRANSDGELENRLWIDNRSGYILRNQEFGGSDHQTVLQEVTVNRIFYDIDFPQAELFDADLPWRGGFARDYTGEPEPVGTLPPGWEVPTGHEPLPYVPSLGKFDPSHSRLTFQYPPNLLQSDPLSSVSLFADGFFLGKAILGNPWTMICDRSPDGSKIAYVSQPFKSVPKNAALYWFSLMEPQSALLRPLGDAYVTQLAFAPDSRRLAAFAYRGQFATGAIFIIDTQSGDARPLYYQGDVKSLVWSPDGEDLAFIGRDSPPQFNDEVIVIRADSGEVTYRRSIDFESNSSAPDWPTVEWGVEFPVEMGHLEDCVKPPGE